MARRRVGGNSRVLRKKKIKCSKKSSTSNDCAGAGASGKRTAQPRPGGHRAQQSLRGQRSRVLKRQAAERMVLKEHTRELETRRRQTRKGSSAKTERRELGKYIRQLKEEQRQKHSAELLAIEEAIKKRNNKKGLNRRHDTDEWEDVADDVETFGADELQNMFAHLTM